MPETNEVQVVTERVEQPEEAAYSIAQDARNLAVELVDESGNLFSHIDLNKVLFLRKQSRSSKCIANIRGLRGVYTFLSDYKYIVVVNSGAFDPLPLDRKKLVVKHELLHITSDFDGKLREHDLQDFRLMVNEHGADYFYPADNAPAEAERVD